MNTPSRRGAAALALAAIGTAAVTGCTAGHAATPPSPKPRHITAVFKSTDEPGNMALEDLGANSATGGPDIGDLLAFTQSLTQHGKPAGQVHVTGVGVDHVRHLTEVTGTINIRAGSIQLAGIVAAAPTFSLAVTGGTGPYAGATGTIDFRNDGNVQTLTVHLVEPAAGRS